MKNLLTSHTSLADSVSSRFSEIIKMKMENQRVHELVAPPPPPHHTDVQMSTRHAICAKRRKQIAVENIQINLMLQK